MSEKILVLGATGTVGGHLLQRLRAAGKEVRAATRKPEDFRQSGVEAVPFDLERPETFSFALEGVSKVFLIARPGDDHADQTALPLLQEMKRAGVEHVVNLTAMGAERSDHVVALRKVELALEASGVRFTHLRPNWFMQMFTSGPLWSALQATNAISIPAGEAKISYIDAKDIAEVAAAAFTRPGHLDQAYTLTGGEALDHHQVARLFGEATKRPIRYHPISEEVARRALSRSLSEERVERVLRFYRLVRQGACEEVSPAVQSILGRPPRSFADFAKESASLFS